MLVFLITESEKVNIKELELRLHLHEFLASYIESFSVCMIVYDT